MDRNWEYVPRLPDKEKSNPMMMIDNKFSFGQIVYLKTDQDQQQRIVTSIICFKGGELLYNLSCGISESKHYDFEISEEKNLTLA